MDVNIPVARQIRYFRTAIEKRRSGYGSQAKHSDDFTITVAYGVCIGYVFNFVVEGSALHP